QSFQATNDLKNRSASYMQPWPMKPIFFVLLAFIVDAILNGAFFAQRSPEYWQGGVTQALAFGFVNMLLGCILLGLVSARYAGHVETWKRLAGIAGVVFAVVAGVLWNAYVGHYRQLLESVPLDQIDALSSGSYIDAFAHMREHPFDLPAWQAIVLLIIGFSIFLFMAVEGYRADDRYPRYGHHDRVHKNAKRIFDVLWTGLKNDVNEEIDRAVAALRKRIAADARSIERASKYVAASEAARREMQDSAADLIRAASAALHTYRETNLFVRTTPPPSYFKTFSTFAVELEDSKSQQIASNFEEAIAALDRNRSSANEIEKRLRETRQQLEDGLARFLKSIENDAAQKEDHSDNPRSPE
ncbi:MAG TPA: hypothetical protein VG897_18010, partial [Terriglobales bacterium]|nr:hypothetical protein [Terriglobales bacterium]